MTAALTRYRRVLAHLVPRATGWAGAIVAALLASLGAAPAAAIVGALTTAFIAWWYLTRPAADRHLVARAVIVAACLGVVAGRDGVSGPLLLAGVLVLGALMAEPVIGRASRSPLAVTGLPGFRRPALARIHEPVFAGGCLVVAALSAAVLGWAPVVMLWVSTVVTVAGLGLAAYQLVRVRRRADERGIRAALTRWGPQWCLYYNGTGYGSYQIRMWLPYLARTGRRGVLLIRDPRFLAEAAAISDLPVVLAHRVEALEWALAPTVRAVFYVNNDARNVDGVRFGGLTHVHLGHGDSDKPASYAHTTAMFDKIFVAGQAGVDRFARHGVLVPREKFVLVGRPQVEAIEVRSAGSPLPERPVVLYAPTWRGSLQDSLFGSLRAGEQIVSALIDAGATVWFRPHPYSVRDAESRVLIARIDALLSGGRHVTSAGTADRSVFECMNASDALVTDVSSVASDYLYSNKPFAITQPRADIDLAAGFPVAGAAVPLPLDGDLAAAVAELLGQDTRREVRARLRGYYLGDWPPEDYAGVFVAAAAEAMDGPAGS